MLTVVHSNRAEVLAGDLADQLVASGAAADPFAAIPIAVASHPVAVAVQHAVARRGGIACGLAFPFLDALLEHCVAEAGGADRLADRGLLHAALLDALADADLLAAGELAPVTGYLHAAGDDPDAVDLRRYQLARNLASTFWDYETTRPDRVLAWERGPAFDADAATEAWQRRLYREARARLGGRVASIAEVALGRVPLRPPPRVDLVGFSYLSPAHLRAVARLARDAEVTVHALNPCRAFWEDVASDDVDDPAPLRLWGRPGREHIRALGELSGHDARERYAEPEGATGLAALQRQILERAPAPHTEDRGGGDPGVRLLACAGPRRELEVVGEAIWTLVRERGYRFSDVAVLVAPAARELYQAHLPSVFAELHDIPFHFVDAPLSAGSRIPEALEALLELPFGRFSRPEMLRVLTHPAVLARHPDVDPGEWIRWTERLGIVHGADHGDHAETYIERDLYNWEQGIRRLALGAVMAGESSGERRAVAFGGAGAYVPEEIAPDRVASVARFAALVRSLVADARFARGAALPLARWRAFLDLYATSYLEADSDADRRALRRCRDAIAELAACDVGGRPVPYRIACELARDRVRGLRAGAGETLADGVMVAALAPMRPLAFRAVFCVGLGEGTFPSTDSEPPLDLRSRRRPTDVSPRERDRYAFLEALLAAREQLCVSYVARDEETGEALEPSAVVVELEEALAPHTGGAELRERTPLRRWDAPAHSPAAAREAGARAIRDDLERYLARRGDSGELPGRAALRDVLDAPAMAPLRARLGLPELEPPPARAEALVVSLSQLRRFLESPLQAWASVVLRLRDAELEDVAAREDEAFATDLLEWIMLLRGVFAAHLAAGDGDDLERRYREAARLAELGGRAPTGVFCDLERERHLAVLAGWKDALASAGAGDVTTYTFGRASGAPDAGAEVLPAIELDVEIAGVRRPVCVVGRTQPIAAGVGSVVLAPGNKPKPKHVLRGFVDHVALAAAGVADGVCHGALAATASRFERHRLGAWRSADARAYLGALIAELCGASHEYLLPFEAVHDAHRKPGRGIAAAVAALSGRRERTCDAYGPVSRLDGLGAPADAEAIAARRFDALFARWEVVS